MPERENPQSVTEAPDDDGAARAVTVDPTPMIVGVTGDYHSDEDTDGPTADPNATRTYDPHRAGRKKSGRSGALGTVIAGRYTLVDVIGEGGMGSVYLASQSEPVKRQVALKLIKSGFDSRGVLARFDAERQALALMDHPNIARIYDGGVTEQAQPFFVMELVQGVPLSDYCDQKRLTVRQRLELFVSICQAIQHAHQKGIIHRDLKPGNVLVTEVDGKPTPKVIDFGVAKATEQKLTDQSLADVGAIVGTPAYMSPEQADPTVMDIDTRTDVYALGVMLYELLTGSPPFDATQFKRGAVLELLRMVREVEPTRPSTRLNAATKLSDIAAKRSIEAGKLAKLLRGELDWVVMKCLEKDRTRRYDTANGLARDIQRYLADEVVEARPPSRSYRLRKFVKRNKGQVIAGCIVLLTLLGGIVGTTYGLFEARQQQAAAQARLKQIERGNEVLTEIFNDLNIRAVKADKDPLEAVLAKRLVKAAEQLEGDAIGDPLAVAELQGRLGQSLISLGYPVQALGPLKKAHETRLRLQGVDHEDRLASLFWLAAGHWEASQYDLALPLHTEALERRQAILGPEHPDTLASMHSLGATFHQTDELARAHELYEKTLRLRKAVLGIDHQDTLKTMNNLANTLTHLKKYNEGIALHEEALSRRQKLLGDDHPDTFISRMALATCYRAAGKQEKALTLEEENLKLIKARLGDEHPFTLTAMTTLASSYETLQKHNLSLPLRQDILRLRKARLGEDNPDTLASMHSLANTYNELKKDDEVLPLHLEALRIRKASLGPTHKLTLQSMQNVATAYRTLGKAAAAVPLLEEVLRITKAENGPDHRATYLAMHSLSRGYVALGKYDLALSLMDEALLSSRARLPADHPDVIDNLEALTQRYLDVGIRQAWFGQDADLATNAERMLDFVRGTNSVVSLERTAKVWSYVKEAPPTRRAEVAAMARKAVELGKDSPFLPYFVMALGMAEYRNDQFTEAAASLAKLGGKEFPTDDRHVLGAAGLFRAMCFHQLGNKSEALALATKTVQIIRPLPADEQKPWADRNTSLDDLVVWMTYKEAKKLIGFTAEPSAEKNP